jgi:large repetitive protein
MPLWYDQSIPFINLAWTASVSSGVTQYKVYRSLTSGSGYVLLNSIPAANLTYSDTQVVHKTPYFYVVTSFDGTNESIHSNEASATTRA